MMVSYGIPSVAFLAATFAAVLAFWLYAKRRESSFYIGLAAFVGCVSLVHLADGLGLLSQSHDFLFWRRLALVGELCLPAALSYVGFRFSDLSQQREQNVRLWCVYVMGLLGLGLAGLAMTEHVLILISVEGGRSLITLALWGQIPYSFIVIAMAIGLAQLEVVLRSSSELTRYRLRLIFIGLGGLGGYQIYQASQMMMLSTWRVEQVLLFSVVSMISMGLLTLGIARSRFKELVVSAYISQQALAGSVTLIIVGLYLLTVGFIGEWLRRVDQPLGFELSVVVVFMALVALAILGLSKTVRSEIRRFLIRNFLRSKYDYRAEWLRVTESFEPATTKEAVLDCLLDLLVKTFSTTTIAIWVFREADQRYCQARPVDLKMPVMEPSHFVIRQLVGKDDGVIMRELPDWPSDALEPFVRIRAELCFPIRTQGQLAAFVVLGKQPHGDSYGTDDCDLLRGICHHAGALLSNARLAEERQASAELEALHRFSLFCLHDLKNLAARLSLVAQNAVQHGRDQAFQESAMRTVTDTASKMTSLMSKLSLKSVKPEPTGVLEAVDMATLVDEILVPMKMDETVKLCFLSGPVQPVMAVREQMHQLLLNVILNARQAISGKGDLSVVMNQVESCVVIIVQDTGCGISSAKLESLFRPSQSSRPGGLGIGLYQCKQIVNAHGGQIQIQSDEGKGTQVTIELPVSPIVKLRETKIMAHTS